MKEILEYIDLIPEFKPVVSKALEGLALYEEDFNKVQEWLIKKSVKSKAGIYKGLIEEGVPPEHAVALTISATNDFRDGVKSYKGKSGKGESK